MGRKGGGGEVRGETVRGQWDTPDQLGAVELVRRIFCMRDTLAKISHLLRAAFEGFSENYKKNWPSSSSSLIAIIIVVVPLRLLPPPTAPLRRHPAGRLVEVDAGGEEGHGGGDVGARPELGGEHQGADEGGGEVGGGGAVLLKQESLALSRTSDMSSPTSDMSSPTSDMSSPTSDMSSPLVIIAPFGLVVSPGWHGHTFQRSKLSSI